MAKKDDGPFTYQHPALSEALRAASLPKRKPTDGDAVPATRVPMTKAQRVALELSQGKRIA
jgi:hypothetical protein